MIPAKPHVPHERTRPTSEWRPEAGLGILGPTMGEMGEEWEKS